MCRLHIDMREVQADHMQEVVLSHTCPPPHDDQYFWDLGRVTFLRKNAPSNRRHLQPTTPPVDLPGSFVADAGLSAIPRSPHAAGPTMETAEADSVARSVSSFPWWG